MIDWLNEIVVKDNLPSFRHNKGFMLVCILFSHQVKFIKLSFSLLFGWNVIEKFAFCKSKTNAALSEDPFVQIPFIQIKSETIGRI